MRYLDPARRLDTFDPRVAGTPALGLDLPGSDLDILCHAPDSDAFLAVVWPLCSGWPEFALWQWRGTYRPLVARFQASGWDIEIFAAAEPVEQQMAWRHARIEARLLRIGGTALRDRVMDRRRQGMKTEPAFAAVLGLEGDPYRALLACEAWDDDALRRLVESGAQAPGRR
ncbi:DUF4269 domain-containing protein [Falsiroseomonas sp. E2-1-a20]|uniref:DUF4269 domain-containing protein n=1 Tax=Falsiroseomonas sp. E2-1-a20 TaxID=3239300 RepID=UPI003F3A827B